MEGLSNEETRRFFTQGNFAILKSSGDVKRTSRCFEPSLAGESFEPPQMAYKMPVKGTPAAETASPMKDEGSGGKSWEG